MIVVRAPLRINFLKGSGKMISATIDKFVYVTVNKNLRSNVLAKYSISEEVPKAQDLKHTRIKAALLDLGIENQIEIATLADVSAKSGLGSSSSFSVALAKALHSFKGNRLSKKEAADYACRLELELLKEPVGRGDQYASAFGGFNVFSFGADNEVGIEPVLVDFSKKSLLEKHLLLFLTGEGRHHPEAERQVSNENLSSFIQSVLSGDIKKTADILTSSYHPASSAADKIYSAGVAAGAYGGKVLGAGGGSVLLLVAPEKQPAVTKAVEEEAAKSNLRDFKLLPVKFVECGADIVFKGNHYYA